MASKSVQLELPDGVASNGKFRVEYVRQAEQLYRLGATDIEVAQFFGIDRVTLYRWTRRHPKLSDAAKVGKAAADDRVERALYARAVGYEYEAEELFEIDGHIHHEPVLKHVPPEIKACLNWLYNRRPDDWKVRVEHTGKGGGAIQVVIGDADAKL